MATSKLELPRLSHDAFRSLVVDTRTGGPQRSMPGCHLAPVMPTPVANPVLVAASADALELIGVKWPDDPPSAHEAALAAVCSGNSLFPGDPTPLAAAYCGFQFGGFAGQLGDGAAMSLGRAPPNERGEAWEVQLKGAGLTPFSRTADGRKVLRSSLREFLCSEAMHHLGVPTTRAATLVSSDTTVERDVQYNGDVRAERCAVVTRLSRSFIRFGSFELTRGEHPSSGRMGPSAGEHETVLVPLVRHTLEQHYSHLLMAHKSFEAQTAALLSEVTERTAGLVAKWQAFGFVHGVLNTDNLSIIGETIDYGPFGFMDAFDPDYCPNGSDDGGRYSYAQQPAMCHWNLERLAESLEPIIKDPAVAREAVSGYWAAYKRHWLALFRQKLGLATHEDADEQLIENLLSCMHATGADFTASFRLLTRVLVPTTEEECSVAAQQDTEMLGLLLRTCLPPQQLAKRMRLMFGDGDPRVLAQLQMMAQMAPGQLERFGLDVSVIERETAKVARKRAMQSLSEDDKAAKDGCLWSEWLSVYRIRLLRERRAHGADWEPASVARLAMMDAANPSFILRQHVAQQAIAAAEKGDFAPTRRLLERLSTPYAPSEPPLAQLAEAAGPTTAALCTTCSRQPLLADGTTLPLWAHDIVLT